MEHVRKGLTATGSLPVLLGGAGFVFDVHAVHYSYEVPNHDDNDSIVLALSTNIDDQQPGAFLTGQAVRADDPSIYFFNQMLFEKPTEVGLNLLQWDRWYPMPKPFRVPWFAFVVFFSGVSASLGVEIFFERVRVPQKEIARLVIDVGGQARTQIGGGG